MNLDDILSKEPENLEEALEDRKVIKEASAKVVEELRVSDENKEEAKAKIAELEEKSTKLESDAATAKKEFDESLKDKDERIATLEKQLATQADKLHKELARKVIALKEALGKPGLEDTEKVLETHCTRTEESLKDQLADLEAEIDAKGGSEEAPPAENPLEAGKETDKTNEKFDTAKLSDAIDTRTKRGRSK